MIFKELTLQGAFLIKFEKKIDERGFFVRTFCKNEFQKQNLCHDFKQDSLSFNSHQGTIRGLHYQDPNSEIKLLQCLQGEIYDILVDIRKESPTYGKWISITLKENDVTALYIPKGIVHGFQTLKENTLLHYKISEYYDSGSARGIRWNDPFLAIKWPLSISQISTRDESYDDFSQL